MCRRSSRLGNRISLMWAADGRTALVSFEGGAIACIRKRGGRAGCFGRKARAGEEMILLGEDDNGDPPGPEPNVRKCLKKNGVILECDSKKI